MPTKEELDRLAEDLRYIKAAIQKSSSVMRWVAWKVPIRWVALVGGLLIIAIAFVVSRLQVIYGGFNSVPGWIQAVFFGGIALFVVIFGLWKIKVILKQLRKSDCEITLWELFFNVYIRHMAMFLVPFLTAVAGMVVFLFMRGLEFYIVPVLAVLMGFAFVFFAMQFLFKEIYGSAFWLIVTGFACLFLDNVIGPMGALALTFGGSMVFLFLLTLFPRDLEWPGGSRG